MRRGMTSGVVVAIAAALALSVLLIWGSSSGSPLVGPPQGTWGPPPITLPEVEQPATTAQPLPTGGEAPDGSQGRAVDWLLIGFVLMVAVVLMIVLRLLLNRQHREREPLTTQDDEELSALLEATGDEVRFRALSESDPRNAVVACWVALEEAVHTSGLRRDPTETASELTERVLGRWQVDAEATRRLAQAYREARFSRHPVSEQSRERAVEALRRIHEDLRQRVLDEQIREAETQAQAAHGQGEPR